MNLSDLINRNPPEPWSDGEKIPWHEPDFSRRMLESHLSQDHDWASRRHEIIDLHVGLIAKRSPENARILDLACGPGFYTQRLARCGFKCTGVDFSPASIEYARKQARESELKIEYVLEDIRNFIPKKKFDCVLLSFGEFNVFREDDALGILRKTSKCLKNNGFLLLEVQKFKAVKHIGLAPTAWQANEKGLFSDTPHLCLQEAFWSEKTNTATARHFVIDIAKSSVQKYGSTTKAYTDDEYTNMLHEVGFRKIENLSSSDWPPGKDFEEKLQVFLCRK